jgi:hypothetical protein
MNLRRRFDRLEQRLDAGGASAPRLVLLGTDGTVLAAYGDGPLPPDTPWRGRRGEVKVLVGVAPDAV